jgi:hypothetical protein
MWAWWSYGSCSYPVHYWPEASIFSSNPQPPLIATRCSRRRPWSGERTELDETASAGGGRRCCRRRVAARKVSGQSRTGTAAVVGQRRRRKSTHGEGRWRASGVPGADVSCCHEKIKISFVDGSGDRDRLQTKSGGGGAVVRQELTLARQAAVQPDYGRLWWPQLVDDDISSSSSPPPVLLSLPPTIAPFISPALSACFLRRLMEKSKMLRS